MDSKVGKYIIEAGTIVFPNLYSMTQDPKFWGSDVTQFRPERFLCEKNGRSSQHDWWDFTFGTGTKHEAYSNIDQHHFLEIILFLFCFQAAENVWVNP